MRNFIVRQDSTNMDGEIDPFASKEWLVLGVIPYGGRAVFVCTGIDGGPIVMLDPYGMHLEFVRFVG